MQFLVQVVATALLSYLAEIYLPWWIIVVCAAVVTLVVPTTRVVSFLGGMVAVGLLWMGMATYTDISTQSILTVKVAPLLGLPHPTLLILLTGLTGGFVAGLGALSGCMVRQMVEQWVADRNILPRRY